MTPPSTYDLRRRKLEDYFDRTAVDAWAKLTSTEPVGRIRKTVREGRDRMRDTLLGYLPEDLTGLRVLDAGCGTGALAVIAARRGAEVVGIDLSPKLVELARERMPEIAGPGSVELLASDMLDPMLGEFDYVVAMDSLIHYEPADMTASIAALALRARRAVVFTFAPRTPMLSLMHMVGKAFPRDNRAPFIEPIAEAHLRERLLGHPDVAAFAIGRTQRIDTGFYMSQAMELVRS